MNHLNKIKTSKLNYSFMAVVALIFMSVTVFAASPAKKKSPKSSPKKVTEIKPLTFESVETKPTFVGGDAALNEYVSKTVVYPKQAIANKEQGEATVQFIIDEKGLIKSAKVIGSASASLDEEALRIINGMPAWTPGMQKGKKVAVQHQLPINFTLPTSITQKVLDNPIVKAVVDTTSKELNKAIEKKVTKYGGNTINEIYNIMKKK